MADLDRALSREVTVVSSSDPEAASLHRVRTLVRGSEAASAVFAQAKAEGWAADRLASALQALPAKEGPLFLDGEAQALRYLADEYLQLGEGVLVVDTATGRAIARLQPEDIWQPLPVPREDGQLATPLPRIRPEIESYLVHSHHEQAREQAVLARRGPLDARQAAGLTKAGRLGIVEQLQVDAPGWWGAMGGAAGLIASQAEWAPLPAEHSGYGSCSVASATLKRGIQDALTVNVNEGLRTSLGAALGARTWADLLRQYLPGHAAHQDHFPEKVRHGLIKTEVVDPDQVLAWVAPARYARVLPGPVLVADVPWPLALMGGEGPALWVNVQRWEVRGRELFDRWEVKAEVEAEILLAPERWKRAELPEPEDDPQVELVR